MDAAALETCARERADELPGVTVDRPFGPEWDVYRVRGKIFMLFTEHRGVPLINLKARPGDSQVLQRAYPEITPGYHMNKRHWVSVRGGGELTAQIARDLVTESYLLVVEKLPRAERPVDPAAFGQQPA